jgi:DedD protein
MPEAIDPQLDELRRRARRRLVGAVVLALAAAVLVPMLLESEPRPLGEDVSVKIPPVDEGKFVTRLGEKARTPEPAPATIPAPPAESTPPVAAANPPAPATGSEAATEKPPAAEKPAPPAPRDDPKSPNASKPAAPDKPVAAKDAPTPTESKPAAPKPAPDTPAKIGTYSVQLAAFSDDKGANALASRLKKGGHPAYTEPYSTSRGTLWRVRVGPYPTREAAEAARSKLKADGQNGIIAAAN